MKTKAVFLFDIERGPHVDRITFSIVHGEDDHTVVDEIGAAKTVSVSYSEEKR